MKQILTIKNRFDNETCFDAKVNDALKNGWELKTRTVIIPNAQTENFSTCHMLYAELEKEVQNDEN